ncbi:tetratricopeptide repeat protein [Arenimonas oryziterrae]|uniref:DUF4034 domain-containing protein n=1 Tax=Arenimonas oryziterrae DSM 21050 = YC6267 TaxID=1121015 RepID=A0A091ALG5_9GAMM|nr:tetratricopeptide repeat protein [Arenimonas oryziterrae]KFN41013.1 hypothetical protein N789_03785 [Arenimonas oryziterrae DSM 21050 = YC6267]
MAEFFAKAKAADALADPLERCLAYPDLPGNAWPRDLAKASCEMVFGREITLSEIDGYLDRKALAELDAIYRGYMERHFSHDDFDESIHGALLHPGDAGDFDRTTARWLEMAPQSAFALASRAEYLRLQAHGARGGELASKTPRENFRRMSEYVGQAIELNYRALAIEPRLMQSYAGLIDLGKLDSRPDVVMDAVQKGRKQDPWCRAITGYLMESLEPQWGGSLEEMMALSAELQPHVAERPLLALNTIWPQVTIAERLLEQRRYAEVIALLEPLIRTSTHTELTIHTGEAMLLSGSPDRWTTAMYLLEATRFGSRESFHQLMLANALVNAHEIEWAAKVIAPLPGMPDMDTEDQYLLGDLFFRLGKNEAAEKAFLIASKDPKFAELAPLQVVRMMFQSGQAERGWAQVTRLNADFPGLAEGWLLRGQLAVVRGDKKEAMTAFRKAIETVDLNKPDDEFVAHQAESGLRGLQAK